MDASDIRTVGVAGAGTMGCGIAQLLAQNGIEVKLYDLSAGILGTAEERILRGLERGENPSAFSLVRKTTDLDAFRSCDFVIEAIQEDLAAKRELIERLDAVVGPPAVLATNTSSLSVAGIASAAENPSRIAGMHFFNPVTAMRLVEVVRAAQTSEEAIRTVSGLASRLGKTSVVCKDTPGFIVNRVARPFYLEGMRLLREGAGSPEAIDRAAREEGKFRMGPFELMDLIGLDVNLAISRTVYEGWGKPERLKPSEIQEELVRRGNLGRKNSRGFYVYGENPPGTVNPVLREIVPGMGGAPRLPKEMLRAILDGVIREAGLAAKEGVAAEKEIDAATRLGLNWPKGPFEWRKELYPSGAR